METSEFTPGDLSYLLSPRAIRDRAQQIFELAEGGKTHFSVHLDELDSVARFVTDVTLSNYPDLKIPFHSRWGHFRAGGVDRVAEFEKRLAGRDKNEIAKAKLDLAVVSVLLDAGAGMQWRYRETGGDGSTVEYSRSEGLAVASFHLFCEGKFSSDPHDPYRADANGLSKLTREDLTRGFQVTSGNPLVGLDGRLLLMQSLGRALRTDPVRFPDPQENPRPGDLLSYCQAISQQDEIAAADLLEAVLMGLGPIWPGRTKLGETPLGDVWPYRPLEATEFVNGLVPFHKLSQWMTYSLIEPIEQCGIRVAHVDELTGLAEYRNGGLLLDRGLIRLRDPALASEAHAPDSELVIEWRALTVHLLEKIAEKVRENLKKTSEEMPLAKVLEGGTWWAGRKIAGDLRADGSPPLKIKSDGTVF